MAKTKVSLEQLKWDRLISFRVLRYLEKKEGLNISWMWDIRKVVMKHTQTGEVDMSSREVQNNMVRVVAAAVMDKINAPKPKAKWYAPPQE